MRRSRNRILTGSTPRPGRERSANHSSAGFHASWPSAKRPIIIKKVKKGGRRRPPRRRLEGGLRRLRDRDDGLLPADVADQHHQPRAEARHRRLFRAGHRSRQTTSGSGGILGGAALGDDGRQEPPGSKDVIEAAGARGAAERHRHRPEPDHQPARAPRQGTRATKADDAALTSAAQSLRQAMQDMPELAELSKQIIVDQTPEGLRIQLVDQEGRSMFNEGSAAPNDRAKLLLRAVAKVVNQLPNRITIAGHTSADAGGAKPAGDWALSSARADASRADPAGRRRRRRPHLPGGRQGRVRPALSRTIRCCRATAASPSCCCARRRCCRRMRGHRLEASRRCWRLA